MSQGSGRIKRYTDGTWLFSRDGRRVENAWELEILYQAYKAIRRIAVRMGADPHMQPSAVADAFDEALSAQYDSALSDFCNNPNKYLPQEKRVDLCGPVTDSKSSELTWSKVFAWVITKVTGSR